MSAMSADEWKALNLLLDVALDLAPEARLAWVDGLGPEHDAVRPRLRRMLELPPLPLAPLTLPHFDAAGDDAADDSDDGEREGGTIGPYRLIRALAHGGMGTVWLADRADGLITRPVALKLPRGVWQRTALLDRMAREREILSRFEHPNIARLYDTGLTATGQPYLALEYVGGRHIDDYCATRGLGLTDRLQLFLQVLDAVAHAHARLVVHRDLKPSNILVTDAGNVKLLDFGIAKLLTEGEAPETQVTEAGSRPLTPGYASPEQVAGEPLTIGSDIYSLGVVFYELLTGGRPARDDGPALPSAAAAGTSYAARLRGDLDTIILKALKPSPSDRYSTVNAFADDIRRHLRGLPILARPDSGWYRLSKFARRHALPLAAACLALAAVIGGAAVTAWQARVAREEQRRAEEVKEFITSIFEGASPFAAAGKTVTASDLLKQARTRIDQIDESQPGLRTELLTLVGASLIELTEMSAAEPILRAAADEGTRRLGPDHALTLRARTALARARRFVGTRDAAAADLESLLPRLRGRPELADDLVEALESHANVAMSQTQWETAIDSSKEMIAVARPRFGDTHPLTLAGRWSLVQSYLLAGRYEAAADEADVAFPLALEAYRDNPDSPALMEARELYGRVLTGAGRLTEGIALIAAALDTAAAVFGPDSIYIGYYAANLAARQLEAGDLGAALATSDRAIAATAVAPGPTSGVHAFAHHQRGRVLLASRDGAAALAQLDLAIRKLESSDEALARQRLPAARAERALALAYTGRVDEALADLREAAPSTPGTLRILGIVQRLSGAHADALATQQKAIAGLVSGAGANRARSMHLTEIGLNQLELGDAEGAGSALREALALTQSFERRPVPEYADLLVGLARVALARGERSEAAQRFEEADAFWRQFEGGRSSAAPR